MNFNIETVPYEGRIYIAIKGAVCPKCGQENLIVRNEQITSSDIKLDKSTSYYYCMNCKWEKGEPISEEEWKNKNRTGLIDKILDEQDLKNCCKLHSRTGCPEDGICKKMNIKGHVNLNNYCPKCLSNNCYYIGYPPRDEKDHNVWNEQVVYCIDCKWNGFYPDLIEIDDEEEYKNYKRTKLIDKVLQWI